MRAPFVLGAFVFCSAACAQTLPSSQSSTNAPAGISPEVNAQGNKGKGVVRKVSATAKVLRRKVPPPNDHGPEPSAPRTKPETIERPTAQRNLREELAEQRANLRMERTRVLIKDQVAAVKEQRKL